MPAHILIELCSQNCQSFEPERSELLPKLAVHSKRICAVTVVRHFLSRIWVVIICHLTRPKTKTEDEGQTRFLHYNKILCFFTMIKVFPKREAL